MTVKKKNYTIIQSKVIVYDKFVNLQNYLKKY